MSDKAVTMPCGCVLRMTWRDIDGIPLPTEATITKPCDQHRPLVVGLTLRVDDTPILKDGEGIR